MLTRASLRYYKATNAMVILGVAVAVAVLAGALLVGASARVCGPSRCPVSAPPKWW
jgi:hypothetical protein